MFFPMGLLAIADLCEKEGFSAKIINYPMEQYFDREWSLEAFLKNIDYKICGIDLHWIFHSYGALEVAKIVKKVNPNAKVVLGGYTATYFHDEILRNYKMIDAIIRGEGEVPFVKYAHQVIHGHTLEEVPNLSYRNSSQHIKVNPITYVASTLDELDFTNISLIHNGRKYIESSREIMAIPFNLGIGRGCPFQCPYCGGGRQSQLILTKRKKVLLRSPEKIIEDLHNLFDNYKAEGIFFGHGTYPGSFKYWKRLFKLIRKEKFDLSADLEIWRLPFPKEMWYEFYRTFRRTYSSISVCPRTLSTRVQEKVAALCDPTFRFPLNQIQDLIKNACLFREELRIWFTIGFPFQKLSDLLRDYIFSIKMNLKYGKSNFSPIMIINDLVAISPASPAYESPERYELKLHLKSFRQLVDIVERTKFSMGGWNTIINFHTNHFSSMAIRLWNIIFLITNIPMFFTCFPKDDENMKSIGKEFRHFSLKMIKPKE